jgi:hypothetical protein
MGRHGANPLELYYDYPADDLLQWREALDHLNAATDRRAVDVAMISGGNLKTDDARDMLDNVNRQLIQPKAKATPRKPGESPF